MASRAAAALAAAGAGSWGESVAARRGVSSGATVDVYVGAPLCAEAKRELASGGRRSGRRRACGSSASSAAEARRWQAPGPGDDRRQRPPRHRGLDRRSPTSNLPGPPTASPARSSKKPASPGPPHSARARCSASSTRSMRPNSSATVREAGIESELTLRDAQARRPRRRRGRPSYPLKQVLRAPRPTPGAGTRTPAPASASASPAARRAAPCRTRSRI